MDLFVSICGWIMCFCWSITLLRFSLALIFPKRFSLKAEMINVARIFGYSCLFVILILVMVEICERLGI